MYHLTTTSKCFEKALFYSATLQFFRLWHLYLDAQKKGYASIMVEETSELMTLLWIHYLRELVPSERKRAWTPHPPPKKPPNTLFYFNRGPRKTAMTLGKKSEIICLGLFKMILTWHWNTTEILFYYYIENLWTIILWSSIIPEESGHLQNKIQETFSKGIIVKFLCISVRINRELNL